MEMHVARDKTGYLFLYFYLEPYKDGSVWKCDNPEYMIEIDKDKFPEVKWEDEKATKVDLITI